jgi:phosphoribosylaminoimidazole-succinocarboxamide synthase
MNKFIRKGKVKDIYELDEDNLIFHFSDRVSAFDVILPTVIPRKGEVLCKFAEYWFQYLKTPNHMVKVLDKSKIIVKKLDIIPIEVVIRGYIYGSYYDRIINNEIEYPDKPILASRIEEPIFDPTTKFEAKDRPINVKEIIENKWLTRNELDDLINNSIRLYKQVSKKVEEAGFIIADIKFEYGRDKEGNILLADSLGPDEFRLWNKESYEIDKTQESYDKQIIRDWLIENKYKKKLDESRKLGFDDPKPPELPEKLVNEVIERYIYTFEKITGRNFR